MSGSVPIVSINNFLVQCLTVIPSACAELNKNGNPDALEIRSKLLELTSVASNLAKWSNVACKEPQQANSQVDSNKIKSNTKKSTRKAVEQEYHGHHATHNHAGRRNGKSVVVCVHFVHS